MTNTIEFYPVLDSLKSLLESELAQPVGIFQAPIETNGNTSELPYIIITPLTKGQFTGAYGDPWSNADLELQICSVGERHDQVMILSDRVRNVLIGRDSYGNYKFPLYAPNISVMDRRPMENSPGKTSEKGNIFEVDDFYIISITTS